jgi:hypothetical protein
MRGGGSYIGPDLGDIGAHRTAEQIRTAIVSPPQIFSLRIVAFALSRSPVKQSMEESSIRTPSRSSSSIRPGSFVPSSRPISRNVLSSIKTPCRPTRASSVTKTWSCS